MPVVDGGGVEPDVILVGAVEPAVARGDAEDVADAVELLEADDELPEHGVEPRAEPPAGDERGARRGRVDGEAAPGPRAAVGDERGRRGGGEVEEGVAQGDVPRGDVEGGRRVEVGLARDGVRDRRRRGRGRGGERGGQARHVAERERRERHGCVGRAGGVGVGVGVGVGRGDAGSGGGGGVHVSASEVGAAVQGEELDGSETVKRRTGPWVLVARRVAVSAERFGLPETREARATSTARDFF